MDMQLDLLHGHAAGICSMDTWSMDIRHGHAVWTYGVDTQKEREAWSCSEMQYRNMYSMEVQSGHEASTRSTDLPQGHEHGHVAWTCRVDLCSGLEPGFQCGAAKGGKKRTRAFFHSRSALLLFFGFVFLHVASPKAREMRGRPPSVLLTIF
jgi:hypothetical protein